MQEQSRKRSRPVSRQSLAHASMKSADKDNATTDIATLQRLQDAQHTKKKSRGKSLGPGGLEALNEASLNTKVRRELKPVVSETNTGQGEPTLTLKSILKPSIPLTPPKVIPSFHELRSSATIGQSATRSGEDLLIDFSTPGTSGALPSSATVANGFSGSSRCDPFSPLRKEKESLQTEEEKREAQQQRHDEKQAILDRRAERRKSLANRRVSFAPEATLHTWSVMELVEDSTTSSGANSTRRQSSVTAQQPPNKSSSPVRRSPRRSSAPVDRATEVQVAASPAHQQPRRDPNLQGTSSQGPELQPHGLMEDILSSSPAGDSITESSPIRIGDSAESESDDDTDGDTAMSMDDTTSQSVMSEASSSTQSSLEERLREGATRAGTRGIVYDEYGDDAPMEMATATVTKAFQPWLIGAHHPVNHHATRDQENVNPLISATKSHPPVEDQSPSTAQDQDETQDMSMDVTQAVGGIIKGGSPTRKRRDSSDYVDETMDFTSVQGGILGQATEDQGDTDTTTLAPIEEQTEPQSNVGDDRTTGMEMTRAIGRVISTYQTPIRKMESETVLEPGSNPLFIPPQPHTQEQFPVSSIATETGSPDITLKPRLSGRSRQGRDGPSTTPKFSPRRTTVMATPTKRATPTPLPEKDKASKVNGRKSLALGAAKGLLGKRPVELDADDDEEAEYTPKRLKQVEREGSPVKKIHLPKPPSKEETTGRLSKAEEKTLEEMRDAGGCTTPKRLTAFSKDSPAATRRADGRGQEAAPAKCSVELLEPSTSDTGKMSLQEFLNLTNVHFIELITTKRRQTLAQSMTKPSSEQGGDGSTEAIFVAAATTLPLLELYQHASRELKSYISTGRKIIRSIEAETLVQQPPLFREYIDARADVKAIMDNQFRNGKTNARYQSKEGWYTWRTQLVEGLQNGLESIKQGMVKDLDTLDEQNKSISKIEPSLLKQQQSLRHEIESLQRILLELDSVDMNALRVAREDLRAAEEEKLRKTRMVEEARQQIKDKEEALSAAEELKLEMEEQIAEADRVRQEFRGWSAADALKRKEKVDAIERQTGWRLSGAEEEKEENENGFGVALTLTFRNQLRLFFYPSVYQARPDSGARRRSGRQSRSVSGPNAPISLTYSPDENDDGQAPRELSTEKRFFLQLIRSQLQAFSMMPKGSVSTKTVLDAISRGWNMAEKVEQEIRLLNKAGITTTSILSDERLGVKIMLVQASDRSRIDIEFALLVTPLNDGDMSASASVSAHAIYGPTAKTLSGSKLRKVQTALGKEVESKELGGGAWIAAIHGFEQWLSGQVQRQLQSQSQSQTGTKTAASGAGQVTEGPAGPAASTSERKVTNTPQVSQDMKRSPLAPKTGNTVKKALPRPSKPRQPLSLRGGQSDKTQSLASSVGQIVALDKENIVVGDGLGTKHSVEVPAQAAAVAIGSAAEWKDLVRPAIAPEEQEKMMAVGTPVKRVGALRRSPI
ncbi:hypothetical protein DV735_g3238, partial [Chaetothyriales sp. CBS 134920]